MLAVHFGTKYLLEKCGHNKNALCLVEKKVPFWDGDF